MREKQFLKEHKYTKVRRKPFFCYRDQLKIKGTVFLPKESKYKPLPIAIICHEFMANRLFSFPYAKELAKNGFAAFCFDFCGGGIISASQGSTTDMSVLTEIADLKSVISFAKKQAYTDESTLLLMGCSQGGLVSALTAAELKEEVAGLILQYPALSIPDDARRGSMIKAKFNPNNIPEQLNCGVMKLGRQYVTDVITMNPFEIIKNYTGNVLILHGDADHLVDISYSKSAYHAYKAAGANITFKTIKGAGHIFMNPRHIHSAQRYIGEFAHRI